MGDKKSLARAQTKAQSNDGVIDTDHQQFSAGHAFVNFDLARHHLTQEQKIFSHSLVTTHNRTCAPRIHATNTYSKLPVR